MSTPLNIVPKNAVCAADNTQWDCIAAHKNEEGMTQPKIRHWYAGGTIVTNEAI